MLGFGKQLSCHILLKKDIKSAIRRSQQVIYVFFPSVSAFVLYFISKTLSKILWEHISQRSQRNGLKPVTPSLLAQSPLYNEEVRLKQLLLSSLIAEVF